MNRHYIFGEFIEKEELSLSDVSTLLDRAEDAREVIQRYPTLNIIRLLSKLRERWLDPEYPLRKKTLELLPKLIRFHPTMIKLGLDAMGDLLKAEHINKKLLIELGGREYLDQWSYSAKMEGYLLAQPLGILLHVAPGNVFVSAVDSLIHGMITKNINILKLSKSDPVFPLLFAESLKEVDNYGILSSAFAIVDFKGGNKLIEAEFKQRCNGIIVWGGEETVLSYRKDLPVATKLVEYGPKYSFGIITQAGLQSHNIEDITKKVARDVVLWEQRACSAPQVVFIEKFKDNQNTMQKFMDALATALKAQSKILPQGQLSIDEAVEITKVREAGKFQEIFGDGIIMSSQGNTNWTVIYEKSPAYRLSPLNRTIYIKSFHNLEEILGPMDGFGGYLQTAGILASPKETTAIAKRLVSFGCTRITEIGQMGEGKIGAPHDGTYQFEQLIKWVSIERQRKSLEIFLEEEDSYEGATIWERFKEIVTYAKTKSKFYKEKLNNIKLSDWSDLTSFPIMTRNDIYENAPPKNNNILTAVPRNAYVFGSGGTTGKPKYIYYYYDELNEGTEILAKIYRIAGLHHGDIVGNLFMAGNLWTSFIAVNKALEEVGCVNLPIAGNIELEQIIHYLVTFKANALIGIPSVIIALVEKLERKDIKNVNIEKILYGGEHFPPEAKEYVRRVTGCKRIVSAGYASVDAGPAGYQCLSVDGSIHHLLSNYQYMEIIDTETGDNIKPFEHLTNYSHNNFDGLSNYSLNSNTKHFPQTKTGEIILTNLSRHLMPIIRYRTGDLARWINKPCRCGRVSPLFELLGRCDERIRVGTVDIYPDAIDNAIAKIGSLSHIFQIIAETKRNKDSLIIKVEEKREEQQTIKAHNKKSVKDTHRLGKKVVAEKLKEELINNFHELKEALEEKWLGDLKVEIVSSGKIPRVERSGKIQRVIDQRTASGS